MLIWGFLAGKDAISYLCAVCCKQVLVMHLPRNYLQLMVFCCLTHVVCVRLFTPFRIKKNFYNTKPDYIYQLVMRLLYKV